MKHRIELDLTDREIDQLRKLMDSLPLGTYAPLVVTVLKALPLTAEHAYLQGIAGHPTPWDDSPGERAAYLAGDPREIPNESTVGTVDPAAAESSRSSACGGGFLLRALTEHGKAALPMLESRLSAAGIPWTRKGI